MEVFLLLIYFLSILVLYQSIEADDSDFSDEDEDEYNLIDTV